MRRIVHHLNAKGLVLAAIFACIPVVLAEPITYQGRLTESNLPATGSYDMVFRVYDSAVGGTLLATAPMVTVSTLDGLIVATPDFTAGTFTGATVYLEISIRPAGGTEYVVLAERQRITPAPLAMRSLNERWSLQTTSRLRTDTGISCVLINDTTPVYADAALSVTRLAGSGSVGGMYVNTTDAEAIPYYGWAADHASLAEARVNGSTGTFVLRNLDREWITITSLGRVGIGTTATSSEVLRVNGNIYSMANIIAASGLESHGAVMCGSDISVGGTATVDGDAFIAGQVRGDALMYHSHEDRAVIIPAEAMNPVNNASNAVIGAASGASYFDAAVGAAYMTAPVYLPAGAYLSGIDAFILDNSAAANISVQLLARTAIATTFIPIGYVESSGSSASVVTLSDTISFPPIDPYNFSYVIYVHSTDWQGSSMLFKGVRVRYTVIKPD